MVKSDIDSISHGPVQFIGQLSDDYNVKKLQMVYYDKNTPKQLKSHLIDVSKSTFTDFYYVFPDEIPIAEGIEYELYFEVFDNDRVQGSKKTKSKTFSYYNKTEKELKEDLLKEQADNIDKISKTLEKSKQTNSEIDKLKNELQKKAEVNWNDSKKLEQFIKRQEQYQEMFKKQTEQLKEVNSLFILEREIIRILLLFGNQETDFVDFIEVEDEEGNIHVEKEKYTNQVSKELYLNLQDDEIEFSNEIFQSIYYEMIHQLNQVDKIEMESFINHSNPDISSIVTSILMDDEKYTLSDWKRKNIFVTESVEVLSKLVSDAILNLRRILIDKKIQQLINPSDEVASQNIDLEMIQNYTELKKRLYNKLMRVV